MPSEKARDNDAQHAKFERNGESFVLGVPLDAFRIIRRQVCRRIIRIVLTNAAVAIQVDFMDAMPASFLCLLPDEKARPEAEAAGFRLGAKGTHTSRTIMLTDLETVLDATGMDAARTDYFSAIVDSNCLSKTTAATRRLSCQRLRELYGLDPALPLFRVLRHLWGIDPTARPRLA